MLNMIPTIIFYPENTYSTLGGLGIVCYPIKIITYSDLRWNTGDVYNILGMKLIHTSEPTYWYFNPGYSMRYHRYNFRKDVLSTKLKSYDPMLTEWENMQLNGYDRIWDCGHMKYEWTKEENN